MPSSDGIGEPWQLLGHGEWHPHGTAERVYNLVAFFVNLTNVFGNSFIFFMFAKDKSLWEPRTLLVLNLAFADLSWGSAAMVTELINSIKGGFATGTLGCTVALHFASFGIALSMQTFMWISVDRWLAIVRERPPNPWQIYSVIASTWVVALMYTIWLIFAGRPAGGGLMSSTHTYCEAAWMFPSLLMRSMAYFTQAAYFSFFLITTYCYTSIYMTFRESRRRLNGLNLMTAGTGAFTAKGVVGGSTENLQSSSAKQSNLSNATSNVEKGIKKPQKLQDQEIQIIKKFVTLVSVFLVTWGMWVFGVVAYQSHTGRASPIWQNGLGAMMAYMNSAVNPILLVGMDNRFTASAKRVVGWA
ncbi:hypothetical protein SpCBS45565_g08303 [Spizellomyces sp. 'palustris']|nr:hypothetical protein SpCBS45565_g08303 [Spizellomyces sp. 'palustris']